jgi:hypothetical protein
MNTKRIVMILHKKGEAEDGQNKPWIMKQRWEVWVDREREMEKPEQATAFNS